MRGMAKASVTLRLGGRPLLLRPTSPAVERVVKHLERLPFAHLMTTHDLTTACRVSVPTCQRAKLDRPDLCQRIYNPKNQLVWGSKRTIARLRADLKRLEGTR